MTYYLIDTNCWLAFIENSADDTILQVLEKGITKNEFALLVPDRLRLEWERKSQVILSRLKSEWTKKIENKAFNSYLVSSFSEQQYSHWSRIISMIERLLASGINFPLSDRVKLLTVDRQMNRFVPFHNNPKSVEDSLIFFSTIEFARENGISNLRFITNDSDFWESKEHPVLHPDLVQNDVQIHFSRNPYEALGPLVKTISPETTDSSFSNESAIYHIEENLEGETYLDQLSRIIDSVRSQQPVVPANILCKIAPFKISVKKNNFTWLHGFTLQSNNAELVHYLHDIVSKTNEAENDVTIKSKQASQLQKLIDWLNENVVFGIASSDVNRVVSMNSPVVSGEDEEERCFFKLDLVNSLSYLNKEGSNKIDDRLRKAYYHAMFGNFQRAIILYDRVKSEALNRKMLLLFHICQYNISSVVHLLNSSYTPISENVKAIMVKNEQKRRFENPDLMIGASDYERDCIDFLSDRAFYLRAADEIMDLSGKIISQYHASLKGGWSNNGYVRSLLFHFGRFESYLDRNRIFFKIYTEFFTLFDRFLEGILASYAIDESADSRLLHFDDYLLLRILYHADNDNLFTYLKRYNIKRLVYSPFVLAP